LANYAKLQRWKPGFVTKLSAEGPTGVNRIIDALNGEQGSAPTPRMFNRDESTSTQQGQAAILVITSSVSTTEYVADVYLNPASDATTRGVTLKLHTCTSTLPAGYPILAFLIGSTWWAQPAIIYS